MKSNKFTYKSIQLVLFCLTLTQTACTDRYAKTEETYNKDIFLSELEISKMKLETSEIKTDTIHKTCSVVGKVILLPENIYIVSLPIAGFVKKINVDKGTHVSKNNILATIEHETYLDLKNNFLIAKADYNFQKNAFERQGELAIERATSMKKMEEAQRNFLVTESNYSTLGKKLQILGIDPESINPDNINAEAYLLSPVKGEITKCQAIEGSYYTNSDVLFEVAASQKKMVYFELSNDTTARLMPSQLLNFFTGQTEFFQNHITSVKDNETNFRFKNVYAEIPTSINVIDNEAVNVEYTIVDTFLIIPKNAVFHEKFFVIKEDDYKFNIYPISIVSQTEAEYYIQKRNIPLTGEIVLHPNKKFLKRLFK